MFDRLTAICTRHDRARVCAVILLFTLGFFTGCEEPVISDFEPPAITVLSPVNGTTITFDGERGLPAEIAIRAEVTDDEALAEVQCAVDTYEYLEAVGTNPYTWTWTVRDVNYYSRYYDIRIDARDAAGNTRIKTIWIEVSLLYPGKVFWVNSTGDDGDTNRGDGICDDGSGDCTLRAAIEEANSHLGADTIAFNIPGPGPHTIQPSSVLPTIFDPVVMDGTSEPDFAGSPIIELDGSQAVGGYPSSSGLIIRSDSCTIQGLVVNRFSGSGIHLAYGSTANRIRGNYIGTDVTGTIALGNGDAGVYVGWIGNETNNIIGGMNNGDGNLISGNAGGGVVIIGGYGNRVLSNSIYLNGELGIDLNEDGLTVNDMNDIDDGPNNRQNYPGITSVAIDLNGDLVIAYNVDSDETSSVYPLLIQFFISDGAGEGKTLLGNDTYTATDHQGGTKSVNLGSASDLGFTTGESVVATATDAEGNTSEFSPEES